MAVKLDGTQNAIILDATSIALTVKSGVNAAPWTLTLPTTPGTAGQVLTTNGNGVTSWVTGGGGGGSPSGPVNSVQFNNAGAFGGVAGFEFDGTSEVTLGVAATSNGVLKLYNDGTSNAVLVRARSDSTAWTMQLPSGPGTNGLVLTTDGTGNTSWEPAGGGTAIPVTDDNTTAADEFPLFTDTAGGAGVTLTQAYTASTEYTFNPSTGNLTAPHMVSSTGIFLNANTISTSYTIPAGFNGLAAGTITFAGGATVTAPPGTNWVII
jgi:hypothetical protein